MKITFCLFGFLFFITACGTLNKTKNADAEQSTSTINPVVGDSSAIPSEYSFTDTLSLVDSLPEEPTNPLEYMTIEEKGMIDEINLLRADPQAYARFIDGYIENIIADSGKDAEAKRKALTAAGELILELQTTPPQPALLPHFRLYEVAKSEGEELVKTKKAGTIGTDGSHPFQRIYNGAGLDGSENIVEGKTSTRDAIISLLINDDLANRAQRRNLLGAQWEYVTCHKVGAVGDTENVWIQLFGVTPEESEDEEIPNTYASENELPLATADPERKGDKPEKEFSFLTAEEQEMVDEINLLRSDPAAYLPFVESFAAKYGKEYPKEEQDFKKAVKELKKELKNTKPLSQLEPHEKLYNVAKAHGLDNKKHNRLEHTGTDKSDPFDRVRRADLKNYIDSKGYFSPNENLVGGEKNPRESVVALLIDAGVPSRGHRRALLEPHWKYVACYKIGLIENLKELKGQPIDDMYNCWVQLFATD